MVFCKIQQCVMLSKIAATLRQPVKPNLCNVIRWWCASFFKGLECSYFAGVRGYELGGISSYHSMLDR